MSQRTHAHALRVAIALLYGGVAPVEPPSDPCLKAPLHGAPATEREWLIVTFDIEDMRVRRHGEDAWIDVHFARWQPDSLLAVRRPGWSRRQLPADSLALSWTEIERIEKPVGSYAALGAGVGAFAGLSVYFFFLMMSVRGYAHFDGWGAAFFPFITVPVGALVGTAIGSAETRWAPIYCTQQATAGDPEPRDE